MTKYAPWLLTLLLGVAAFLFWWLRYPFALSYQEQFQLFLFDGDYFWSRVSEPGGLARYVSEFLVQFYNNVMFGAVIIALLYMLYFLPHLFPLIPGGHFLSFSYKFLLTVLPSLGHFSSVVFRKALLFTLGFDFSSLSMSLFITFKVHFVTATVIFS